MKRLLKAINVLLIASMVIVPFSTQAGMISTYQVTASSQTQLNREKIIAFVNREDVAKQIEAMGVTPTEASARVNAMTPDEVNKVAANIDTLPAGAMAPGWWWAIGVVVVAWVIYLIWK